MNSHRLGSATNAIPASGLSREQIAGIRQVALRSTRSQAATQPPPPTQPRSKTKLQGPWEEDSRTRGAIRAASLKSLSSSAGAPQVHRPHPLARKPSTEGPQQESKQPVSSHDEQDAPVTKTSAVVPRGSMQKPWSATLPFSKTPIPTLQKPTQEMTPTAPQAENEDRSIHSNTRPSEPAPVRVENIFPPHGSLLKPAPPSASQQAPGVRPTLSQAMEAIRSKWVAKQAAEAAAASQSWSSQREQAISHEQHNAIVDNHRTSQQNETDGASDSAQLGNQDVQVEDLGDNRSHNPDSSVSASSSLVEDAAATEKLLPKENERKGG